MHVPPIDRDAVLADPVLGRRFGGRGASALQGNAIALTDDEGRAIDALAGGLPPLSPPLTEPTDEPGWLSDEPALPPERIIEGVVSTKRRLWRSLGFPERPTTQQWLPNGKRLDLIAPGVVADVKRRVYRNDGPAQIEGYVKELERTRANDGPWRALLIQNVPTLNTAARERIEGSDIQIEVWTVLPGRRRWSGWRVEQLL